MKLWPYFELVVWITALICLAQSHPNNHHFSLCPIAMLGYDWCPGCGLGRAISSILIGNIYASFQYHWLGIPALLILVNRIFILGKNIPYLKKKPLINIPNELQ